MNKYNAILHTFCDACFNQKTCKGACRRINEMEKFIHKYDKLATAYDKACSELCIGTNYFTTMSKNEVKEYLLNDKK